MGIDFKRVIFKISICACLFFFFALILRTESCRFSYNDRLLQILERKGLYPSSSLKLIPVIPLEEKRHVEVMEDRGPCGSC